MEMKLEVIASELAIFLDNELRVPAMIIRTDLFMLLLLVFLT